MQGVFCCRAQVQTYTTPLGAKVNGVAGSSRVNGATHAGITHDGCGSCTSARQTA